jgi:SOS-response transcriptional repressor LexA
MVRVAHFGKTLRKLIDERKLSMTEFSEKSGIVISTLYRHLNAPHGNQMHPRTYRTIAEALGMTIQELDAQWRATRVPQSQGGPDDSIPVVNKTPAGPAVDYQECYPDSGVGHDYITKSPWQIGMDLLFAVVVVGNSMEPEFRDGDYLVFRPIAPHDILPDGTAVFVRFTAERNSECTFKRVFDRGDELEFRPDNPKHRSIVAPRTEIERMAELIEVRRRVINR